MSEDAPLGKPDDWKELEAAGLKFYPTYEEAVHSPVQFIMLGKDTPGDFSFYRYPQRPRGSFRGSFAKYVLITPYQRTTRWVDDPDYPGRRKGVRGRTYKRAESDIEHIIAHEIGHHVLGHGDREEFEEQDERVLDEFGVEGSDALKELAAEMWTLGKRGRLDKYRKRQMSVNVPWWRDDIEPIFEEYIDYLAEKFNVKPSIVKWIKSIRPASERRGME